MNTTATLWQRPFAQRWLCALVAGAVLLGWGTSLSAQEIDYRVRNQVRKGEKPALILQAREPLKTLEVKLKRSDGKKYNFKRKNVGQGKTVEFAFPQAPGEHHYVARLIVQTKAGVKNQLELEFDVAVAADVNIKLIKSRSSLQKKVVTLQATGRLERAEMVVYGEGMRKLESKEFDLSSARAGQDIALDWKKDGVVEKINVKIHVPGGFWNNLELIPFSVHIPHEEVVFNSGKATFTPSEAPKLDKTLALIVQEIEKHGDDLEIQLYIAGYTDTVGNKASNLSLSAGRARAIGAYFRKKGLKIPIYYQGFGEEVLAVGTKDEVDESRNRRAVYILSNQSPPKSKQIPRLHWKRL